MPSCMILRDYANSQAITRRPGSNSGGDYLRGRSLVTAAMMGISRVYVGVHWPTDVLAGWSIGAAWAALCWLVARLLQRRGQLEPQPMTAPATDPTDAGPST